MNNLKKYILGIAAIASLATLPACQDHFDEPNMDEVPVATMQPNTTIAQVKEWLWRDDNNYCTRIHTIEWYNTPEAERTDDIDFTGTHIIISGRVVSSDYAGNCFKYIVLQDETGALNFSINSYNLYLNYRMGQEIVVDLTDMYMGKYRGLEQVGFPSYNTSLTPDAYGDQFETSFMAPELFRSHIELNGRVEPAKVDTLTVDRISDLSVTPAGLRYWQSRIVRFNNVEWVPNTETPTLSTYHSSGVTQQIRDTDGNTLDVRTSGYANFWNINLPAERCDVVAIMGYYVSLAGTGGWQLTLLDANSIMNVGSPSVPKGNVDNPYNVLEAIALQVNDQGKNGWVRGYIVGTVAPEVETVSSNDDIEWTATPTLGNTLVIGQTAETKDIAECLVVALPQGSALRTLGALRENPDNYGKQIDIRGTFAPVMGTYGITGNSGSASEFKIEGKGGGESEKGDGSEENPYTCAQVIAMAPSSTTEAVESGIWVKGYIVGYYENYDAHFETATTQRANILISDKADAAAASDCVCIQLVAQTDVRNALNLVDNPTVLGAQVSVQGDVMKYNTLPGIKNTSAYKINGEGPGPGPDPQPGNSVVLLDATDGTACDNWTFQTVSGPDNVWSWKNYNNNYYLNGSAYVSGAANASEAWAISPIINLAGNTTVSATFEHAAKFQTTLTSLCGIAVREEGASSWTMLTVPTWPAAGSWTFASSGNISLSSLAGKKIQLAFKYGSTADGADTWEIRNLTLTGDGNIVIEGKGEPGPTPDPDPEPQPTDEYKGQFNTFNGGTPKSTYGTYTNATGWEAVNSAILSGVAAGGTEQNPRFAFIGDDKTLAVALNGNNAKVGVLTSPVITGGISQLSFKYGFAFSDTQAEISIQFIQGGNVVKEETLKVTEITQKTAYDYSLDVNLSGDFQIIITNKSLSNKASNCDRIAIWNLTWE